VQKEKNEEKKRGVEANGKKSADNWLHIGSKKYG